MINLITTVALIFFVVFYARFFISGIRDLIPKIKSKIDKHRSSKKEKDEHSNVEK